jgi:hypothetical protein
VFESAFSARTWSGLVFVGWLVVAVATPSSGAAASPTPSTVMRPATVTAVRLDPVGDPVEPVGRTCFIVILTWGSTVRNVALTPVARLTPHPEHSERICHDVHPNSRTRDSSVNTLRA